MIAAIKEWAWALFMTAFAGGLAGFIAPNNPSMKKYVKLAATVCAAAVMIMPLKNIVGSAFEFNAAEAPDYAYEGGIAQTKLEEIVCAEINDRVYAEFGVYAARVYFDGDTLVLETAENAGETEKFARSVYFGDVRIINN